MRDTDELVGRLARVRDDELAGQASGAGARTLLTSVMSAPVVAATAPGRSWRLRPAAGAESAASHHRSWKLRLAVGTAAAGLLVTGVVAGPGLVGGGSATSYANSAVDIVRDGDQYVARIKDPFAEYKEYTEAFRAVGLKIDLRPVAVSPSGVGKILGMMITDRGMAGTRLKVETNPSGPILDGVALSMETVPKDCRPGMDEGCVMVMRIPAAFTGEVYVRLGRQARPSEEYANFDSAMAPGEMFAGVKLRYGRSVDDVLAEVRKRKLTAVFSLIKVDGKAGGLSFEPLPAQRVGGSWTVWNAWQVKSGVIRLLVTPERLPENPFFNGSAPPPALS